MRLDFNVLWVDDQPKQLEAQIYKIKQDLYTQGFEFKPTICETIEAVETKIADSVFSDEIDLILVDWDLGHGQHGQDAIAKIRQVVRFKDIIFYSSRTETSNLKKYVFEANVDGVFVASKDKIVIQIEGVFEALVKKVLDLDHIRGIVMGATSDIDELIRQCLASIHNKEDSNGKDKLFTKVHSLVQSKLKDTEKRLRKLGETKSLEEIFDSHDFIQALDRLRMINEMLKDGKYDEHNEVRLHLKDYIDWGIHDRNALGHLQLTPSGKPEGVTTTGGKVINLSQMLKLRILLLDMRSSMRRLKDSIAT